MDLEIGLLGLSGILLLPLAAFAILLMLPGKSRLSGRIASAIMLACFCLALPGALGAARQSFVFSHAFAWLDLGSAAIPGGLLWDALSGPLTALAAFTALCVCVFSIAYMKDDPAQNRYYAFLMLFAFSMFGLSLSPNLLQLYVFWELVGLSSYLLIGFWRHKEIAAKAAKKAFLYNRIGDIGFLAGILLLYAHFGTLEFSALKTAALPLVQSGDTMLTVAALCLFGGCIGKSAQFPLSSWLPDAMEGPTPASALIHAATMVAAGVYLMARVSFLIGWDAGLAIALIGGITAFTGAYAALSQTDIKKTLAYSTVSQLGFMVMAIGALQPGAAYFHLFAHAFFKAGLFLAAGSVIHALHESAHVSGEHFDAQDMQLMGGLRKKLPLTFGVYCVFAACLAGLPFTSGFLSKESILAGLAEWAVARGGLAYIVPALAFLSAFFTAFYIFKQLFLVFLGGNRLSAIAPIAAENLRESGWLIKTPLVVLAVLSTFLPFSFNPFDAGGSWAIGLALSENPLFSPTGVYAHTAAIASVLLAGAGIFLAYLFYIKNRYTVQREAFDDRFPSFKKLSFNFCYFDALYEKTFVRFGLYLSALLGKTDRQIDLRIGHFSMGLVFFSHLVANFDKWIVDGFVNFAGFAAKQATKLPRLPQTGDMQGYVAWLAAGLAGILFYFIV